MKSPENPKDSQLFEVFRSIRTEVVRVSESFHGRLRKRLVKMQTEETARVDTERVAVSGLVQIVNLALSLLRGGPPPPQPPSNSRQPRSSAPPEEKP